MFEKLAGRAPGYLDARSCGHYAVVAPYLSHSGEFLFEVRAQSLRRQPGEIAFPGGRIEDGEEARQAALRETCEELLVEPETVDILAPLDIYTAPGMEVQPFLANLNGYNGSFETDEVAEVFTVPFTFFLENEPQVYVNQVKVQPPPDFPYHLVGGPGYHWSESSYKVLFYQWRDRIIWGMTARFMHNIVELYRQA